MDKLNRQETPAGNSSLAKVAVSFSASTFVVKIATFAKPQNVSLDKIADISVDFVKSVKQKIHDNLR
jgi:hypothetical protein